MQKDFHYNCIAVLCQAAGFKSQGALTIAYASQYVDDSTESERINLGTYIFDPIRTAHLGLQAYDWSVQKRVFMPFHFIPSKPIRAGNGSYLTEANSKFAQDILNEADSEEDDALRLCRIGVALHTFADSYAHEGFSGRWHKENDVEGIYQFKQNKWRHLLWENCYLDLLPQIGHAEAGYFPDQSYQYWKYKRGGVEPFIERNNGEIFLTAAETIYNKLLNLRKQQSDTPIPWDNIQADIANLLRDKEKDVDKRCKKWQNKFQSLFDGAIEFKYDKLDWRSQALEPKDNARLDWDDIDRNKFYNLEYQMKPGFYQSLWVNFHRAAQLQRHYVLENLF